MKVIILGQENENHTAPIKWALERAGYRVACWGGLAWNAEQQASLRVGGEATMTLGPHTVEPGDRIWVRRPDPPRYNPAVTEADKKFAELEYRSFYHCLAYMMETQPVWCINRYSASRFVNNKSVQLELARRCRLRVPRALMSNSPQAVKDLLGHNGGRIICKGFTPHVWARENDGGIAVTETFELKPEQLPADEVLTYAPAIYQEMVVKEYDIRMLLMGRRVYSYALHNPKKALDWRQDAGQGRVQVEIVPTPPEVEKGVLEFAQLAGICFGSLDFAVDKQGQWWFLEINEQGQFLWLDQFNSAARTQEKFCAFITAPEDSMQPLEERQDLFPPFAEYEKLAPKQEYPDLAAVAPGTPYMSVER